MSDQPAPTGLPGPQGLYHPRNERDSCGIGFVASIKGEKSHDIILKGVQILLNLAHRGACGCDPETGDGAGVLIQIPHEFFAHACAKIGFSLPNPGEYGVGMVFLPIERHERLDLRRHPGTHCARRGPERAGLARHTHQRRGHRAHRARIAPLHRAGVHPPRGGHGPGRARAQALRDPQARRKPRSPPSDLRDKSYFYLPSLSSRTIVYKGLLLAPQIASFYRELSNPELVSALCLVHQRFSTKTFPPGNWRTRSATCATTARSTRCVET